MAIVFVRVPFNPDHRQIKLGTNAQHVGPVLFFAFTGDFNVDVRGILDHVRTRQQVAFVINEETGSAGDEISFDFEREFVIKLGTMNDNAHNRMVNIVGNVLVEFFRGDGGGR